MEDASILTPYPSDNRPRSSGGKNVFIVIAILVLLVIVSGGSFYLGSRTGNSNTVSPSPSPKPIPSAQPTQSQQLISPTNAVSASPSAKISAAVTKALSPTPTPISKSLILQARPDLDGFRSSNGGGNVNADIRAGRNSNLISRGFVSFELAKVPTGIKIEEVTLKLFQAKVVGNPYASGGNIKLDHLTYGDTLDEADYSMAALLSSFATVANNITVGWKEINVTQEVKDDISNARSVSQFRLHFTTENKGGTLEGDFAQFESAENTLKTGNTPQLIVKYTK